MANLFTFWQEKKKFSYKLSLKGLPWRQRAVCQSHCALWLHFRESECAETCVCEAGWLQQTVDPGLPFLSSPARHLAALEHLKLLQSPSSCEFPCGSSVPKNRLPTVECFCFFNYKSCLRQLLSVCLAGFMLGGLKASLDALSTWCLM